MSGLKDMAGLVAEYTADEAKTLLDEMAAEYDLARIVDPIECRIIGFDEDGSVNTDRKCYGIWNAGHKCTNCASAAACRSGVSQEKAEYFDGKVFNIASEPIALKLPDGTAYDAVMELVKIGAEGAEPQQANDRAAENVDHMAEQFRAAHDDLTGVLDASAFYELSRDMLVKDPGGRWMMITCDIQNFKLVNTLFGVEKGNEVLLETATLMKAVAIKAGGVCGRIGGDQFALLVTQAGYDEGALRAAKDELAAAFNCGIYSFVIHFGVYQITSAATPISVMCGRANSALTTIRDSVKETVAYFDDAILEKTIFEQAVIGGFAEALEGGQFQMFLQPLVDASGKVFGGEALTRWVKEDGTVVMPEDFIEVLEAAGLICELDMHIWDRAVAQLAAWKDTEKDGLVISVNMSAKDLFSVDVYEILCGLIEKYQVDASRLKVELTETAFLEDPESSAAVISKLRERGFVVAIDDFGKGYSSLSMLRDIKADVLKIDRSLLAEIENEPRTKIILGSIIDMARSLGMDVVTEGVETGEQLDVLRNMGCSRFQGFYFAKPMPVAQFCDAAGC